MDIFDFGFDKNLLRIDEVIETDSVLTNSIQPSQIVAGSLDLGRIQVLPDEQIGLVAKDDVGSEIFKIITGDTDVGDVVIGNIAGDYAKWDKSAGTFTVKGTINVLDEGLSFYDGANLRARYYVTASHILLQLINNSSTVINELLIDDAAVYSRESSDLGTAGQEWLECFFKKVNITQTQTSGHALAVTRNLASGSTDDSVAHITQDSSTDDQLALDITQDGLAGGLKVNTVNTSNTGDAVYILAQGNQKGLNIYQDYASCTEPTLDLNHGGDGAHIIFQGDPTNTSSADGELWFNGTNLRINIGGTVYNIDMTAI